MSEASAERKPIRSIEQLRTELPAILAKTNADQALALAAAINPLKFLDELGYDLSPPVVTEIEERGRFSKRQVVQRREAIARIDKLSGGKVELTSAETIAASLQAIQVALKPDVARRRGASGILVFSEGAIKRSKADRALVEALIDYRRIEDAGRTFASDAIYASVREGKRRAPLALKLTARLSAGARERNPKRSHKADA